MYKNIKFLQKFYYFKILFLDLSGNHSKTNVSLIENIYGFINNAVKAEYEGKPYTENTSVEAIERKKEGYKPEQREYDDEFFENLYDNFKKK